jgi:hypothetical protein
MKASKRSTIFNAMFSRATSGTRVQLQTILINGTIPESITNRSFVKIARYWTKELNGGHIQSDKYAKIVLNSVYTLSPLGHNAESFRLFEAMEAGSIPIISLGENYKNHKCRQSLHPFLNEFTPYGAAPMIVLSDWDELPDTLKMLTERSEEDVDDHQRRLLEWYYAFMKDWALQFEQRMRRPRMVATS